MRAQARNTLLIDDSPEKAIATPDNAVHPPTWTPFTAKADGGRPRFNFRELMEPSDILNDMEESFEARIAMQIDHNMATGGRLQHALQQGDDRTGGPGEENLKFHELCRFLKLIKVRVDSFCPNLRVCGVDEIEYGWESEH